MLSVRARRSAALLARQTALTRAGSIGGVLNGMTGGGLAGGLAGMSSPVLSGAMGMGSGVRYQHAGMTQNVASRMSLTAHGTFGVTIVPQQQVAIVERFGRFHRKLEPGLNWIIPVVDKVTYIHSLKEEAISIPNQVAITRDNVSINLDAVLFARVEDAVKASYGVENPARAITLLAQTTMRSELGKLTLDKTFEERESLNARIVSSINAAAGVWGITCLRYEIRDISPPPNVRKAMELQAEAERRKRAQILDSEGEQQAAVNLAEGHKRSTILSSEAQQQEVINRASGDADAIRLRAEATATAVSTVAASVATSAGKDAVALRVAEQYVSAFGAIAKAGNTLVLPANAGDVGGMVAQALTIFKSISSAGGGGGKDLDSSEGGTTRSGHGGAGSPRSALMDGELPPLGLGNDLGVDRMGGFAEGQEEERRP